MGFSDIPKVETSDTFLDIAFSRAASKTAKVRRTSRKFKTKIAKSREMECIRIETVKDALVDKLNHTIKTFPSTDNVSAFYLQLLKTTLDFTEFKKSLGALNWGAKKVVFFWKEYRTKIRKCSHLAKISDYRREYYGRIASVMKQIKPRLKYLDQCRKTMRSFPTIKELPSIALVGFPNVGKTSLLYKLTGSKAEIAAYAFTTRGINVGYIGKGKDRIQLLDTPGTLNRFDKMNYIEKQAYLAMKLVADHLIYVFDPTETYPIVAQEKLYKKAKRMGKDVIVYISKTDIAEKDIVDELVKKFDGITKITELKKLIKEL
ncbi:MAG: GTPase [Candidatus Nanoarchaeia archaeon]